MRTVISVLLYVAIAALLGCLLGLIPFFLGRYRYRPNLGRWGMIWCAVAGPFGLAFFVALGYVIAILVFDHDVRPPRQMPQPERPAPTPVRDDPASGMGGLMLLCLAGPLKGQSYSIGREGLMFGRDADCAVRFPSGTGGISRHHCALRWQQGVPVLVDLDSAYGTFLGGGEKLPPHYPTTVAPGARFYLATPAILFQITTL